MHTLTYLRPYLSNRTETSKRKTVHIHKVDGHHQTGTYEKTLSLTTVPHIHIHIRWQIDIHVDCAAFVRIKYGSLKPDSLPRAQATMYANIGLVSNCSPLVVLAYVHTYVYLHRSIVFFTVSITHFAKQTLLMKYKSNAYYTSLHWVPQGCDGTVEADISDELW